MLKDEATTGAYSDYIAMSQESPRAASTRQPDAFILDEVERIVI
jgi:hypothetical protein